jgi:hypothetical protein
MAGSMRQRGSDSWQLRVHVGRDPSTGRKRYVERTFRGNKREASKALASLIVETEGQALSSRPLISVSSVPPIGLPIRIAKLVGPRTVSAQVGYPRATQPRSYGVDPDAVVDVRAASSIAFMIGPATPAPVSTKF